VGRWLGLALALAVSAAPWSQAAADALAIKLIAPDLKSPLPLNSSFDLKIQTEPGAECQVSITHPGTGPFLLDKRTADDDGYIDWTVETGGQSGSRSAWVMCSHNGKKGSLSFSYRQ
jgi:hypothetical protein